MFVLLSFLSQCESRESICCDSSHSQTSKQEANIYKVKTRQTLHTASYLLCNEESSASEMEIDFIFHNIKIGVKRYSELLCLIKGREYSVDETDVSFFQPLSLI